MTAWTDRERALLAPYVTNLDGDVYCIRGLPPEVVAVLFAYVSRSPLTFRQNLLTLLVGGELEGLSAEVGAPGGGPGGSGDDAFGRAQSRARKFHEKWVVGYGHASVAEHADLKFAVDGLSIVASKVLEDNRLGGYTEKSTRYQLFDPDAFVTPPDLAGTAAGRLVAETCRDLLGLYVALQEPVRRHLAERWPCPPDVRESAWSRAIEARVCDVVRYVMPAATRTSVGVSMNARTAAHAITKLLSHPLAECRRLGAALRDEGRTLCPALLRYADENPYLRDLPGALRALSDALPAAGAAAAPPAVERGTVRLVHWDPDAEERVLAALLYGAGGRAYGEVRAAVTALPAAARDAALEAALHGRGPHDWPPRALEATAYTMELTVDYGAFRDIQRHRMATQLNPLLDCALGFDVPPELAAAGLAEPFGAAMERAAAAHAALAGEHPAVAQYVVPLAYRKRVLFTWNLREIEHFVRLRSGRQGHRSYRRVACDVADAVAAVHPRLATLLTVDRADYDLERLAAEERLERKRERARALVAEG